MSNNVSSDQFERALHNTLELYAANVVKKVNQAGETAVKDLVKKTKKTAPKRSGAFKKAITSEVIKKADGMNEYVWCVKAPHYRLTHLLVHGHATAKGGRTRGNPFLHNAVDDVLPKYEAEVEKAVEE